MLSMWIERLILNAAEKKFRSYRERAEIVKQVRIADYQKYLPEIAGFYQKTTHWHGTGRFRYERIRDAEDEVGNSVFDVLEGIIDAGGLQPYKDPWIDSGGKTVSLATVRMLARAFARVHAHENTNFLYELGSIKFWLRLYYFLFFVWLCTDRHAQSTVFGGLARGSFFRDVRIWESAVRRPGKHKTVSILNGFRRNILVSDIEGNYPILIGVAPDAQDLIETTPIAHKFEQRSLQPISLQQFTHIEVPLLRVEETKIALKERGIPIPVIPLEFGDIYLADQPLDKLAYFTSKTGT